MSVPNPGKTVKRVGCACGCGTLAVIAFATGIVYLTCSNFFAEMMGEKTYEISGDVRHFDPFAKLAEVQGRVGANARLVSIEATFVRADGTMDLKANYTPFPMATYTFHRPMDKPPENEPPIGAGRGPDDVWYHEVRVSCYQPGQRRQVTRSGGGTTTRYQYTHLGMDVDDGSPRSGKPAEALPPPKLSTRDVWEKATAIGARGDAVARIRYDRSGYEFRIDGTDIRFECDLEGNPRNR